MEQRKRIFVSLSILIVLIGVFFTVSTNISKYNGLSVSNEVSETGFQKCLKTQDIKLYLNSSDTDNALMNLGLLDYLQDFKIQNCFLNSQPCSDNKITDFPTWVINGKKHSKDLTETELAEYSSCSLK